MSTARPITNHGYQSITEGTAAAAAADDDDDDADDAEDRRREEVHMEFVVRGDSSSEDDPPPALSRRALLASWIVASSSALLVALLLMRWYADSADSTKTTTPGGVVDGPPPLNRPCEIHVDGGGFRMIQTSLGDPGAHWSGVPCARSRRRRASSSAATEEEEAGAPPDGERQRPSAVIDVDFDVRAFPDRPPILGFGGAFTEATALNFWSLNERGRETALELLFGESGLGYRYVFVGGGVPRAYYCKGGFDGQHASPEH